MRRLIVSDVEDASRRVDWVCGQLVLPYDCVIDALRRWVEKYGVPRKLILEFEGEW